MEGRRRGLLPDSGGANGEWSGARIHAGGEHEKIGAARLRGAQPVLFQMALQRVGVWCGGPHSRMLHLRREVVPLLCCAQVDVVARRDHQHLLLRAQRQRRLEGELGEHCVELGTHVGRLEHGGNLGAQPYEPPRHLQVG